jgi:peptide/nickel transport system ATP-binding protein
MTDRKPLIEVDNLRVRLNTSRGPADAVRGVSFSLARGETLGLIGESGCGKSVTAMALMGLLPDGAVVSGSVRLEGQELVGLAESDYCKLRGNRVSMIFQEPMTALNPMHTVGRQVAEPLRRHRAFSAAQARQEAIALLDRVGLPDAAKRVDAYPHQFSGGQRQRITIARALVRDPAVLVLDEATASLDAASERAVQTALERLQAGRTTLVVAHRLATVQNATRIVVLAHGRVVDQGTHAELLGRCALYADLVRMQDLTPVSAEPA